MYMKKILIKIIGLVLLLVVLGFGAYYFLINGSQNTILENTKTSDNQSIVEYKEDGNSISLVINRESKQTLSLSPDALLSLSVTPKAEKFITNLDVDFDGQNDVGVFQDTGYAGVNNYYDFYIYNSETQKLEKTEELSRISNPTVNIEKKEITSAHKSGPYWDMQVYQYVDGNFLKKAKGEVAVANGAYEYSQNNKWLIVRDSYLFEGERSSGNLIIFDKVTKKIKAQIPKILGFAIISNEGIEEGANSYINQNGDKILISEFYDLEPSQLYDGSGDYNPVPNQDKLNKLETQLGFDLEGQIHAFGGKPVLGVGLIYVLDLNTMEKTFVRLGGYDGFKNTNKGVLLMNDKNLENPALPVNRWFNPFNNVNSFSYSHVNNFVELDYSPKILSENLQDSFERWEIKEVDGFKYKLFY
jgi:hypothetical protein